jgi:hypothetical protein
MAISKILSDLLEQDKFAKFTKTGNTTATLGSLTLDTAISGPGGIDTGSVAASTYTDSSSNIFKAYYFGEINQTIFSAKVGSTGVVSDESFDWINGNLTSSSAMICTFNSGIFSVAPNCSCTTRDTTFGRECHVNNMTTSGVTITRQVSGTTTTSTDFGVTLHVHKQGIDTIQPDWFRLPY